MRNQESKKLSKADIDAVNLWLADVDRGKWKCLEGYYKGSIECDFYGGTACAKIFTKVKNNNLCPCELYNDVDVLRTVKQAIILAKSKLH